MKTITIIEPSDVKFLQIDVGPRYWEDSEIKVEEKWEDDIDYLEQKKGVCPKMPFAVKDDTKSYVEYRWRLTIDLIEGKILDWPMGVEARVFYKVCDDGTYYLLDGDKNVLEEKNCYVPEILAYEQEGWGDYLIMKIDENGKILNYPDDPSFLIQRLIDTKSF